MSNVENKTRVVIGTKWPIRLFITNGKAGNRSCRYVVYIFFIRFSFRFF